MLIGYARVSTVEQDAGFEAQERDLKAAGIQRMFSERTSAVGQRKALEEALDFAREGDAIVVTKLDRLARSVADLVRFVERLTKKGVGLRILAMGVDTATPTGKLARRRWGGIAGVVEAWPRGWSAAHQRRINRQLDHHRFKGSLRDDLRRVAASGRVLHEPRVPCAD